jgi:hypothetical protein
MGYTISFKLQSEYELPREAFLKCVFFYHLPSLFFQPLPSDSDLTGLVVQVLEIVFLTSCGKL